MIPQDLLSKWHDLCSGETTYDPFPFSSLLMEANYSDIKEVFNGFPFEDELCLRVNRVKKIGLSPQNDKKKKDIISDLVKKDFLARSNLLILHGEIELIELIKSENINFFKASEYYKNIDNSSSWPDREMFDTFGDIFEGALGNYANDLRVESLTEACYGFTKDYYLTWYILAPFSDNNYDFEYYVQLAEIGANHILTDTCISVYIG